MQMANPLGIQVRYGFDNVIGGYHLADHCIFWDGFRCLILGASTILEIQIEG